MTHADTLRGMANGPHPGLSNSAVVALLAGAEALDSVCEQADAIETLSGLLAGAEEAAIEKAAQIERVRDAYDHAHALITEALEGDADEA